MDPRDRRLQRTYGDKQHKFGTREWNLLFKRQGKRCGICRAPGCKGESHNRKRRLYVDHDHKTGRVRGLLCFRCNHRLLGRGLEDAFLHRSAADYLLNNYDARRSVP